MGGGPPGLGTGGAPAATGGSGGTPGGGGTTPCTATETHTIEYVIDGERHRVLKKRDGAVVGGYLWESELRIAAELDATGAVVSRYVYGERANVPEYVVRADGTYRIVTDHLGSPRLVVEVATGAVLARMSYDAWGNVLPGSDVGVVPFGFAGGLYDAETGLARFGARDYDPGVGRWTGKDPIRFDGGDSNLFAYVSNNPVNGIDIDGRSWGSAIQDPLCYACVLPFYEEAEKCKDDCGRNCGDGQTCKTLCTMKLYQDAFDHCVAPGICKL
ncbi:MAG: hypothetical protein IT373_34405 [Polyangiaceae bacterium]|nr:hypothetical protein [Polyangiaceae bacterium]